MAKEKCSDNVGHNKLEQYKILLLQISFAKYYHFFAKNAITLIQTSLSAV